MMRFAPLVTLSLALAAGCNADPNESGGSAGSGACLRATAHLRSCGLLSDGETDCAGLDRDCEADCVLNMSCSELESNLCPDTSSTLIDCIEACSESFGCTNGNDIPAEWQCDGEDDCEDNSDEVGCSGVNNPSFACGDGTTVQISWQCDGENDCENGRDEVGCGATQFTCGNGTVIPLAWKCDAYDDCGDNSDEVGCPQQAELVCPGEG